MPLLSGGGGSGGASGVSSVTAADTSIVVGGTAADPTLATGTLDAIATAHPPAAAVPFNGKKLTGIANGTAATDAAAFGQIPAVPVASVFGRTGAVVSAASDYALTQIAADTNHALALSGAATMGSLGTGTAGQRLQSGGASADPSWVTVSYSGAFDIVNTAVNTDMLQFVVAGNTLGANGAVLVTVEGDYLNNTGSARGMTHRVQVNGTNVWGSASSGTQFAASSTLLTFFMQFVLANENATNSQRLSGWFQYGDGTVGSLAGLGAWVTGSTATYFGGSTAADSTANMTIRAMAQHTAANASLELRGSVHVQVLG